MKISIIGMSGCGKTYWSKKLETYGFRRVCCDDLIEEKLGNELQGLGYSGIQDVAKWMGQPFDYRYTQTSRKYLAYEEEVVMEFLAYSISSGSEENTVLDTTGSVIYLSKRVLEMLIMHTTVFYLNTPPSVQQEMYQLYSADPKPVIWRSSFINRDGETGEESLAKCYPDLLTFRTHEYEKMADYTLDYHLLRSPCFAIDTFIEVIREKVVINNAC